MALLLVVVMLHDDPIMVVRPSTHPSVSSPLACECRSLCLPPHVPSSTPPLFSSTFVQFLEEREMGNNSTLVPPPSLQRFIGAEGFAAFVGDRGNKRPR